MADVLDRAKQQPRLIILDLNCTSVNRLELIKQLGVQLYAQKHMGAPEKGEG